MRFAAPPTRPPVKKAAPVEAIGVIELPGATLLITNVIKLPAPMPFTTSPITPVFKLDPIPLEPRLATLRIDDLRLTIVLLRGAALLKGVAFRLVVTDLRLRVGVFLKVLVLLVDAFRLPNAMRFRNAAFFAPFSLATCN
jgi:hypothetical protein